VGIGPSLSPPNSMHLLVQEGVEANSGGSDDDVGGGEDSKAMSDGLVLY